jgi:hypothetical protein
MRGALGNIPALTLLVCAAAIYPVQWWIDSTSEQARVDEEALYLSNGTTIGRIALGYEALLADVYWMRVVQYFGRKVLEDPTVLNERSDRLALIYPLTDIITDLDPRYTPAYRFGGFFTHDYVDQVKGFSLLNKGIQNNPNYWPLYQDLAFLYWTDGRCEEAAETYTNGSRIPGAPPWMATLAGSVMVDCGNLETAREMYLHMGQESTDPRVKTDIERKLVELQALEEVTLLREAVVAFKQRNRVPPTSLTQLRPYVRTGPGVPKLRYGSNGVPLDPNGAPYFYDPNTEYVGTDLASVQLPQGVHGGKVDK